MGPGEAMVAMTLFLTIGGAVVLRGPLGKALAERIAGRHLAGRGPDSEQTELLERTAAELDEVRHRLAELEERQDFAERLLARQDATRLER
jgi:hypothetical protein